MVRETRYRPFGVAILKQEVDDSVVGKFQHSSSEAMSSNAIPRSSFASTTTCSLEPSAQDKTNTPISPASTIITLSIASKY
jgi:hypothetical protein